MARAMKVAIVDDEIAFQAAFRVHQAFPSVSVKVFTVTVWPLAVWR